MTTDEAREAEIEAVAEAWASIDGRLGKFLACKGAPDLDRVLGHYSGYCAEASELVERLRLMGYTLVGPAPEVAASSQMMAGEG